MIITILSLAISDGIGEGYGIYISKKATTTIRQTGKNANKKISSLFMEKLIFLPPNSFQITLYACKTIYHVIKLIQEILLDTPTLASSVTPGLQGLEP